ncbi:hypothetical protein TCDM_06792 [Trypanosoma cruzi Dm28c]|uniref:Uncharacterized protein n=1 Tax=Trypanosoma cruzi Dm28c TaxID=1416333 RepID=V5AVW5_TRYCR|nr:hypothetical protein TCDM_06792 [Trypanosoma cruzi Dm28c]
MRCCGRSNADVVILITLYLVTSYSVHSYYTFLFPQTLSALGLAFLQPFRRVARPNSSFPLHLHNLLNVATKEWILFGVSLFCFFSQPGLTWRRQSPMLVVCPRSLDNMLLGALHWL